MPVVYDHCRECFYSRHYNKNCAKNGKFDNQMSLSKCHGPFIKKGKGFVVWGKHTLKRSKS